METILTHYEATRKNTLCLRGDDRKQSQKQEFVPGFANRFLNLRALTHTKQSLLLDGPFLRAFDLSGYIS